MKYYSYISKMTAQNGKLDEVSAILLKAAGLLENNSSCISYIVSKDMDNQFIVVNEVWEDKQSHDASLQDDNVKQLIMTAVPLLAAKPEVIAEATTLGGKGVSSL